MHYRIISIILIIAAAWSSCTKPGEYFENVNPEIVTNTYLSAWKSKDWKTMFKYTKIDFIRGIRAANPVAKESDEELFARELSLGAARNQFYDLKSYEIISVPMVRKGGQKIMVDVRLNGQDRKLNLVIEEMMMKIDLGAVK